MAPNDPRDNLAIEAGLWLVCDRTPSPQWEGHPRREPKPARERLDPVKLGKTRAEKWPKTEAEE